MLRRIMINFRFHASLTSGERAIVGGRQGAGSLNHA